MKRYEGVRYLCSPFIFIRTMEVTENYSNREGKFHLYDCHGIMKDFGYPKVGNTYTSIRTSPKSVTIGITTYKFNEIIRNSL